MVDDELWKAGDRRGGEDGHWGPHWIVRGCPLRSVRGTGSTRREARLPAGPLGVALALLGQWNRANRLDGASHQGLVGALGLIGGHALARATHVDLAHARGLH